MKDWDQNWSFGIKGALSSAVEHYLHTVVAGNEQIVELQSSTERASLPPEFRSDYRPKRRGRGRLLVRIARGLYRYGPNGTIYWCRKINKKNVWKSLETKDRERAMAISALNIYAAGQNGNTEITRLPDGQPSLSGCQLPDWMVNPSGEPARVNSNVQSLPAAVVAPIGPTLVIAPQPPPVTVPAPANATLNDMVQRYKASWNNLAAGTRVKMDCHFIVAVRGPRKMKSLWYGQSGMPLSSAYQPSPGQRQSRKSAPEN
jgi:hypothetical protein